MMKVLRQDLRRNRVSVRDSSTKPAYYSCETRFLSCLCVSPKTDKIRVMTLCLGSCTDEPENS